MNNFKQRRRGTRFLMKEELGLCEIVNSLIAVACVAFIATTVMTRA